MDSIINALLVGGVGVAIVNALAAGLKRRASAQGRKQTHLDAALRSRHVWMTDDYRVRTLAAKHDVPVPDLPDDPYDHHFSQQEDPQP